MDKLRTNTYYVYIHLNIMSMLVTLEITLAKFDHVKRVWREVWHDLNCGVLTLKQIAIQTTSVQSNSKLYVDFSVISIEMRQTKVIVMNFLFQIHHTKEYERPKNESTKIKLLFLMLQSIECITVYYSMSMEGEHRVHQTNSHIINGLVFLLDLFDGMMKQVWGIWIYS